MEPNEDPRGTRPFERTWLGRMFIIAGPLGLLLAISVSLWTSYGRVRLATFVQMETVWRSAETLAVRAQLHGEPADEIETARLLVEQGETASKLADLAIASTERGQVVQGSFTVPDLELGEATVALELVLGDGRTIVENLNVQVASEREPRPAISIEDPARARGDNTDPQPDAVKIDVRPDGSLRNGFATRLFVRALDPSGSPITGTVDAALEQGSFAGRHGSSSEPPQLVAAPLGELGLVTMEGELHSDVLVLGVRVRSGEREHRRRIRLLADPGAISLRLGDRERAQPTDALSIDVTTLTSSRPVFVDVFGVDGAFAATVSPLIPPEGAQRALPVPNVRAGVVQLQASHFPRMASATTALARVELPASDLHRLATHVRSRLDVPRGIGHFDRKLEAAYIDVLEQRASATDDRERRRLARDFLLATLPTELYEPPVAHDGAALAEQRRTEERERWRVRIRWFLIGGGSVYLVALLLTMVVVQRREAAQTLAGFLQSADAGEADDLRRQVRRAERHAIARALVLVAIMAAGLWLTVVMLESLLSAP